MVLLEKGARIDAQNNDDSTPLHLAALNGHLSAVKKLLEPVHDLKKRIN
ncbi:ankyrin repeat domain-containing protein [Wolbachia endosymbiont of Oryzaephilus surinamensis]